MFSHFFCFVLGIGGEQSFPPPLPHEEEQALFLKKSAGDNDARTKLIEHNLRLVAHIVRKYYISHPSQDDLVSIGSIGLIKAVDTFNVKNGAKFATYAAKCIQNEILMFFRAQKKYACEVSLEETIDIDKDGNPLTYSDVICCDDTFFEDLDIKIHTERALFYISTLLSPREKEIIVLRYGLGKRPPKTQREVAELLGISRSYVSRIEKKALTLLREKFGEEGPDFNN
jgi:RNA polymerase sporulation-specific sigma factor